jgi:amino acid transporter
MESELTNLLGDEVIKVRTRVPKSIIASCAMNSVMQLVYIIVLLFTLGDADKVVNSPTGLPLIEVYWEATGSKNATNLFVVMVAVIIFIGTFNIYASVSRLTWAFSRDKGLPFSDFFSRVGLDGPAQLHCLLKLRHRCIQPSSFR